MRDIDLLENLRAENARLVALLEANAMDWRPAAESIKMPISLAEPSAQHLRTDAKLVLFRRLFRGRSDVYPIRWESKGR